MSVDDLIAVTGLTAARSTAYAARKATKLWRIFQPFAEPAGIVLDCESQFRDFPAELDLTPPEARKIVKLIEKEVEADKRGQHRPTREQLKPIIAATVGLRGIGPEKRKAAHNQAESRLQEPTAKVPSEAPEARPGMFGRGPESIATGRLQMYGDPSEFIDPQTRPVDHIYVIRTAIQKALAMHLGAGDEEFRRELRAMLYEEWNAITTPATSGRRAK